MLRKSFASTESPHSRVMFMRSLCLSISAVFVMVSDLFMKAEYFISCFMLQVSLWGRARLLLWGRTIKVMDLLDTASDELFLVHSLLCLCASRLKKLCVFPTAAAWSQNQLPASVKKMRAAHVLGKVKKTSQIENWIHQILWYFYTWLLTKCAPL
jgi:hypothetical protein